MFSPFRAFNDNYEHCTLLQIYCQRECVIEYITCDSYNSHYEGEFIHTSELKSQNSSNLYISKVAVSYRISF